MKNRMTSYQRVEAILGAYYDEHLQVSRNATGHMVITLGSYYDSKTDTASNWLMLERAKQIAGEFGWAVTSERAEQITFQK
tara:strand:- start:290 stop:532 length:243 start_codon:yes stop_codon:yes gene_type:complete